MSIPKIGTAPLWLRTGRVAVAAGAVALLAACSAVPQKPLTVTRYDLGTLPPPEAASKAQPTPLVLAVVKGSGIADSGAGMTYRLAYANAYELRAYAQARWSQPATQLIQLRMRDALSQQRPVMLDDDGAVQSLQSQSLPAMLRLDVEEFNQVFDSATASNGVLRLRATLTEMTPRGERWLAQKVFSSQQAAATADASGGAAAMAAASNDVARQLDVWLRAQNR